MYFIQSENSFYVRFFLWGAMKNSVCSNNLLKIDDIKMAFTECIRNLDRAILNTVL
jgi:hypothetical protein